MFENTLVMRKIAIIGNPDKSDWMSDVGQVESNVARPTLSAPLVFEITTYKLSILDFNQSLRPSAFSATSAVSLWFSNYNLQIINYKSDQC
jgi:hypothetical protein